MYTNFLCAQVDTTYIYNTSTPFGALDIRIAKSATRYYYLQENITFSFRESSPGVKTNSFRDMTSWDSNPYTQGNLREKNGAADNFVMNYRLLFPKVYQTTYDPGYPLIVMLHGAGESGNCWDTKCFHADRYWSPYLNDPAAPVDATSALLNNDHNLMNGGAPHLNARNLAGTRLPDDPLLPPRAFPGFVLFPQNLNGWGAPTVQDAIRLIRLISKKYNIDENRIYLHGLSDGGYAVYEMIKRAPWLFAAALPMSAISDASVVSQNQSSSISVVPMWMFQGGQDTSPSPGKTEGFIKKFREAGASIRYTLYPNLGHGVWNTAYSEPDFFSWMLSKNKSEVHVFADRASICLTNGEGVKLQLSEGFKAYQWEHDGVIMSDATLATYTATTPGSYRARFSRVSNPSPSQWNKWSSPVVVTQQSPATPEVQQVGTLLLKDLNNTADAKLKGPTGFAHYFWYKNGTLLDLPGTVDDTIRSPVFKQGDCTMNCSGNGSYTLVTAGFDNCPSAPSQPKNIFFNDQAPLNITVPQNFSGQVLSAMSVRLTWLDASSNETGFEIWRRKKISATTYSKWELVLITPANTSEFNDARMEPSTTYQYKIRAINESGRSDYAPASSQTVVLTTLSDMVSPSAPSNLMISPVGLNAMKLSWMPSFDDSGIKQYHVYYGNEVVKTGNSQTSFILKDLPVNHTIKFSVRAEDFGANMSDPSDSVTISTFYSGLYYEHSTGAWTDLDVIDWSKPEFKGTVSNFSLSPRTQDDYFYLKFDGYLYITTAGAYQFRTVSDDGSRVELNNVVVVDNDGVHTGRTATGAVQNLTAGPHRITVRYFEYSDGQTLTVKYKGPETGEQWVTIPDNVLRSTPPSTPTVVTESFEESMSISVYPNPAPSHDIHVKMEDNPGAAAYEVQLINFTGQSVCKQIVDSRTLEEGVLISPKEKLPNGLYILLVRSANFIVKKTLSIRN